MKSWLCKDCYGPAKNGKGLERCKRCGSHAVVFSEPRKEKPVPEETYKGYTLEDYAAYFPIPDVGLELTNRIQGCFDMSENLVQDKDCHGFLLGMSKHVLVAGERYVCCHIKAEGKRNTFRFCLDCMACLMENAGYLRNDWKNWKFPEGTILSVDDKKFYPPPYKDARTEELQRLDRGIEEMMERLKESEKQKLLEEPFYLERPHYFDQIPSSDPPWNNDDNFWKTT